MSRCQQPESASKLCPHFHLRGESCPVTQGSSHTSHGAHRGQAPLLLLPGLERLSRALSWHFLGGVALPKPSQTRPWVTPVHLSSVTVAAVSTPSSGSYRCGSVSGQATVFPLICVSLSPKSHCLFFLIIFYRSLVALYYSIGLFWWLSG